MTVKSTAQERLERLRKKFGDIAGKTLCTSSVPCVSKTFLFSGLENSMNITPKVSEGADDELVFCERGEPEACSLLKLHSDKETQVCLLSTGF